MKANPWAPSMQYSGIEIVETTKLPAFVCTTTEGLISFLEVMTTPIKVGPVGSV